MTLQPISYRGRTVEAATRTRFFLAEILDERPADDPEHTFVIFMCAYRRRRAHRRAFRPVQRRGRAPLRARVPGARGAARARGAGRRAGGPSAAGAGMRASGRTRRAGA